MARFYIIAVAFVVIGTGYAGMVQQVNDCSGKMCEDPGCDFPETKQGDCCPTCPYRRTTGCEFWGKMYLDGHIIPTLTSQSGTSYSVYYCLNGVIDRREMECQVCPPQVLPEH